MPLDCHVFLVLFKLFDMIKILIFSLICSFFTGCNDQNNLSNPKNYLALIESQNSFKKLLESSGEKVLQSFPNNPSELINLYGYKESPSLVFGTLYDVSQEHFIELHLYINKLKKAEKEKILSKFLKIICSGLSWQPDGINSFKLMIDNSFPEIMVCNQLNQMPLNKKRQFIHFQLTSFETEQAAIEFLSQKYNCLLNDKSVLNNILSNMEWSH